MPAKNSHSSQYSQTKKYITIFHDFGVLERCFANMVSLLVQILDCTCLKTIREFGHTLDISGKPFVSKDLMKVKMGKNLDLRCAKY